MQEAPLRVLEQNAPRGERGKENSPVTVGGEGEEGEGRVGAARKKGWGGAAAKSLQSCPTLCDPIDGSPPGSPVPGILQATGARMKDAGGDRRTHGEAVGSHSFSSYNS